MAFGSRPTMFRRHRSAGRLNRRLPRVWATRLNSCWTITAKSTNAATGSYR
jgi:hypothetical protein